jgi:2-hydroxymuconate-semialdehyde hydrolase
LTPVWNRLAEIRCPVLLTAGEHDRRYAEAARRMAAGIPGARVKLISDAGHAPQLEAPDNFEHVLLEFLDEHLGERVVVDGDAEAGTLGNR